MKEIALLKKFILEAKDLSEPVNYFFDLMDQDNILYDAGQHPVSNLNSKPELCAAIEITTKVISDFLNKPINIINHMFMEIVQEKFYHGSCMVSGFTVPMLILYCADYHLGIGALTDSTGYTNYFRFSLANAEDLRNKH